VGRTTLWGENGQTSSGREESPISERGGNSVTKELTKERTLRSQEKLYKGCISASERDGEAGLGSESSRQEGLAVDVLRRLATQVVLGEKSLLG